MNALCWVMKNPIFASNAVQNSTPNITQGKATNTTKNGPPHKSKTPKIKTVSLLSRSYIYIKQVCVVTNTCFATAGKENVNVLQVTAPCLSVVCVKCAYNV